MKRAAPAAVFLNPFAGAGGAGRKVARVRDAFARQNFPVKIMETRSAGEFRREVRSAIDGGCKTLIAMGGDGTLRLLVREAICRDVRIGVIPAGGGNDFAASLGISKDLEESAAIIARGKWRAVDVLRVLSVGAKECLYLGAGGMGLDTKAVGYAGGKFLRWPGRLRYLASAIAALRNFSELQVQVEFPESNLPAISKKVLLAAVLNTPTCGGGLRLAPEAQIDDGMLDVVMLETLSKREVLALIPRLLLTGELKTDRVERFRVRNVRLAAEGEAWFQGDGELLGIAPVEICAMPKALRVFAP
jgi:diacylglycerol kinase (ATP)